MLQKTAELKTSYFTLCIFNSDLCFVGKLCIWCNKNPTLSENGLESDFCSELCFHVYRRDSFKKRSNCIWCSGIPFEKHSGGLIDESKFCSEECVNNYKVKLFCEETSAHLGQIKVCEN